MSSLDTSRYTRQQLIDIADASPQVVGTHDKKAWLDLFSNQGVIQDPVGTRPHRAVWDEKNKTSNKKTLGKFWDTYIATNDIKFHVHQDVVGANMVFRDVDIEIKASTGLVTVVPTYILYELTEEDGKLKIARLAAHWELIRNVKDILKKRWGGFKMMIAFSFRMPRFQGVSGLWGYMKGMRGIHKRGKNDVQKFADAVNAKRNDSLKDLFDKDSSGIEFPVGGKTFDVAIFAEAAGAQISISEARSAGWFTGFRFEVKSQTAAHKGVGLFEFSPKSKKIKDARFFWDK